MSRKAKNRILITVLVSLVLISCSHAKFKTLLEADSYLAKAKASHTGKISYYVNEPAIRKYETAANYALRTTGLVKDNQKLPISPKELPGSPSMYGVGGHKAPYWDVTTRITFNRSMALIRTEPGKPPANIVEMAVGRVGQPPQVSGCLIEKIQIIPHWPSDEYKGADGSVLIAAGVSVKLLYSASQNARTECNREAGEAYVKYMEKLSESIKGSLEENGTPHPSCMEEK